MSRFTNSQSETIESPSTTASSSSNGTTKVLPSSRRRSSRIDIQLLAAPEQQETVFEGILARRDGSVLSRNTILKSEHFGPGKQFGADLKLLGAPNFRQANLSVFGVAQPTVPGLKTILRLLRCGPHTECRPETSCTWFSTREEPIIYLNGRPFVLRDIESPFENIRSYAGISANRLEQMEQRLKLDIATEAASNNGLLLVHDEVEEHQVVPCLTTIESIKTSTEVFADMLDDGFCVDYKRVPVSNEHSPTDAFIDDFVDIFQSMPIINHAVIFSSGIGIGRTTYAMVIGMILRRALLMRATHVDPFTHSLETDEDKTTCTVLRLVSVLEQGLQANAARKSAVEWTFARGNLIDNLKAAILGNYHVIAELLRVLDKGNYCKRVVDEAIDQCEALLNIREQILINRVKHSVNEESNALDTGIGFLERYFSLIAFCAFIEDNNTEPVSFAAWIKDRRDIWNMLQNFRRNTDKIRFFRPIDDISELSARQKNTNIPLTSAYVKSHDEIAEYNVIKSRSGSVLGAHTILKIDHWNPAGQLQSILSGAPNFRQIPDSNIYASAQPTLPALRSIVGMMQERLGKGELICWINVREEPVIYIDNEPYVLRDRYATLRNIKSYSGITGNRLEQLEQRLKDDILCEAGTYSHRVLVHCESKSENIFPSWVSLENEETDVMTLCEIFHRLKETFPQLIYLRLPMTAEEPAEPEDFDTIMAVIMQNLPDKLHIIFNCQMGASRSTSGAVVGGLVNRWRSAMATEPVLAVSHYTGPTKPICHYRIIHSVLRVIQNGLECKAIVDETIDKASAVVNLRDCIEDYRSGAQSASDPNEVRRALRKGIAALKRYTMLILFQGYLQDQDPKKPYDQTERFANWLARHPEFSTLLSELDRKGISPEVLNEEGEVNRQGQQTASEYDVRDVVKHRKGQVLAAMTILKFDHFPGCQKTLLLERIEGAPNFRPVELEEKIAVYGLAMPTKQGFINTLVRINAPVVWCCLREEPVVYIKGRPYVLRIVQDPVSNIEMTGIVSERVELMEEKLKEEVLSEAEAQGGRLLLHEEDEATGKILPVWETVEPAQVETTAEIMQAIQNDGYLVKYARIPITDEQAPIPEVFDHLLSLAWDQRRGEASCHAIYNCQMGRGRTTTGMVISTLVYFVRHQSLISSPEATSDELGGSLEDLLEDSSISSEQERELYLAGNYKLINQLLPALEYGKRAKRLVDTAIDHCDHVQNLRKAIYDYKVADGGDRGLNYLLRYFFLIVFAEYLIEMVSESVDVMQFEEDEATIPKAPTITFSSWLQERREITNMIARRELLDFS